ncbi:hypothetical protein [Vibrio crassostreae]|uniref:hypothetical protein n=1 Tax=Vibrio crassostreae TaxID=246167 RepID=UPI001B314C39|nr:hypothetical protein [Vibrio crassostreae]
MKKVFLSLLSIPMGLAAQVDGLTKFEKHMIDGNIEQAELLVDHESVRRSHVAALSHMKGRFMSMRSELSDFGKQLNAEGEAIAVALDGASINMSMMIRKVTSSTFDTRYFIQDFLGKAVHEDCTRKRTENNGIISLQNLCPTGEIVFRLQAKDGEYYLTGVKTAEVNSAMESVETISQGEIFL